MLAAFNGFKQARGRRLSDEEVSHISYRIQRIGSSAMAACYASDTQSSSIDSDRKKTDQGALRPRGAEHPGLRQGRLCQDQGPFSFQPLWSIHPCHTVPRAWLGFVHSSPFCVCLLLANRTRPRPPRRSPRWPRTLTLSCRCAPAVRIIVGMNALLWQFDLPNVDSILLTLCVLHPYLPQDLFRKAQDGDKDAVFELQDRFNDLHFPGAFRFICPSKSRIRHSAPP